MDFAILRFIDEEDAPGVIATRWINRGKNSCLFPNVRSEEKKNKLLIAKATPGNDWLECRIRILKEFTNYQAARSFLSEAEDTSNLESGNDCSKPRKRKIRYIRLPGEESTSEEDDIIRQSPKQPFNVYSTPPPVASYEILRQSTQNLLISNSTKSIDSSFNEDSLNPNSQGLKTFTQAVPETTSNQSPFPCLQTPQTLILEPLMVNMEEELSYSSIKSPISGSSSDIEQLKLNQKTMWSVLTEFLTVAKQIESKMDSMLVHFQDQQSKNHTPEQHIQNNEHLNLISLLPVGIDNFIKLNETIAESSVFRQKLTKILTAAGGRDPKALAANILRKVVLDDIGEKYSLTGKASKTGIVKQSFEKTEVYKIVLEICLRTFRHSKENLVREAVSDWLMQAKFRKSRREKRMTETPEAVFPDLTNE